MQILEWQVKLKIHKILFPIIVKESFVSGFHSLDSIILFPCNLNPNIHGRSSMFFESSSTNKLCLI